MTSPERVKFKRNNIIGDTSDVEENPDLLPNSAESEYRLPSMVKSESSLKFDNMSSENSKTDWPVIEIQDSDDEENNNWNSLSDFAESDSSLAPPVESESEYSPNLLLESESLSKSYEIVEKYEGADQAPRVGDMFSEPTLFDQMSVFQVKDFIEETNPVYSSISVENRGRNTHLCRKRRSTVLLQSKKKLKGPRRDVSKNSQTHHPDEGENETCSELISNGKPLRSSNEFKIRREKLRKAVKVYKYSLGQFCLACGKTITLAKDHPYVKNAKLCHDCALFYKEHSEVEDEEKKMIKCAICIDGGDIFICEGKDCPYVICSDCVELLDEKNLQRIKDAKEWYCYVCTSKKSGLIDPHTKEEIEILLQALVGINFQRQIFVPNRRPIRVLSLFDGIGTVKLALKNMRINVDKYFYSEIDPSALRITRANHPDSKVMKFYGNVIALARKMKIPDFKLGPFDLVIGGSPCNDLSRANPNSKGFDFDGKSYLFSYFEKILTKVKETNDKAGRETFFLFENVNMLEKYRQIIDDILEKPSALYNSRDFSAQNRERLFWGNIPGMYENVIPVTQAALFPLQDILEPNRKATVLKVRTVTCQANSLKQGPGYTEFPVMDMNGRKPVPSVLFATELEKLFGFPEHYTDHGLSFAERHRLLGQSFTVPLIEYILQPLKYFFQSEDDGIE